MASAAILRSLRRREVASAPFSAYKYTSLNSSYIGQNLRSFSCVSVMEGKNPKVIENAEGARTTPSVVAILPSVKKAVVTVPAYFNDARRHAGRIAGLDVGTSKRIFSTMSADIKTTQEEPKAKSFRPLSPHLPVYQPQMNSMLSIFNRISGVYLTGVIFGSYLLYLKMGMICLTYPSFYQTLYLVQQSLPVINSVTALAVLYHTTKSIHSLLTH